MFKMKKVDCHNVKLFFTYFLLVESGAKKFQVRLNDRDYKEGDFIALHECGYGDALTGKIICKRIGFVTNHEQKKGYVVFSLLDLD